MQPAKKDPPAMKQTDRGIRLPTLTNRIAIIVLDGNSRRPDINVLTKILPPRLSMFMEVA